MSVRANDFVCVHAREITIECFSITNLWTKDRHTFPQPTRVAPSPTPPILHLPPTLTRKPAVRPLQSRRRCFPLATTHRKTRPCRFVSAFIPSPSVSMVHLCRDLSTPVGRVLRQSSSSPVCRGKSRLGIGTAGTRFVAGE